MSDTHSGCGLSWAAHGSTAWWPGWRKCPADGLWYKPADDPPEYDPDDGEAQRIAEVYADARAEQDRGL